MTKRRHLSLVKSENLNPNISQNQFGDSAPTGGASQYFPEDEGSGFAEWHPSHDYPEV